MRYIRTRIATGWQVQDSAFDRFLASALSKFIPEANPNYRDKMHLVQEWCIEFDEDGVPWREIGLGSDGAPVLAGPSEADYGFWIDTDVTIETIDGQNMVEAEFQELWIASGVIEKFRDAT